MQRRVKSLQSKFPFRSGHFSLPAADHRPPSVSAVETQQRHHFLQHPVFLHRPPSLNLGVEHALQPRPEQPNRGRICPAMADPFRCDGRVDFGHSFLVNVVLPYVHHFQCRSISTRRLFCRR
ncbi:hypothetical protein LINPERPRIM_LOCUS21126 [Linum perenne]